MPATTMVTETQPTSTPAMAAGLTDDTIVDFNGKLVRLAEATVSVAAHALHYGTGVFEGIRGYWNADREELYVLKLAEHVDRFFRSCGVLRIRPPFSQEQLCEATLDVLRANN